MYEHVCVCMYEHVHVCVCMYERGACVCMHV